MQFKYTSHQDIGRRQVNQDSVMTLEAETEKGPVLLMSVCDGMGGLSHGEIASSAMIDALNEWFEKELPDIIYINRDEDMKTEIFSGFRTAAKRADRKIREFSGQEGIRCGTTAVALLLIHRRYYIMNIGDSRAYLYRKHMYQLTKDQTQAQMMIDNFELSEKDACTHKASSILLQCVGAGSTLEPEFQSGTVMDNDIFLLCSDGFRHKVTKDEMELAIKEEDPKTHIELLNLISYLTEVNKRRGEQDNISTTIVRVFT